MDLADRDFWKAGVPLWRVVLIVLALGTVPGFGAALILSNRISDQAHDQLVRSQTQIREGCERQNSLRRLLNRRSDALAQLQEGLIDFMAQARRARLDRRGTSYDPRLADQYQRDISKVAEVPNEQLPVIDCAHAYKFVSSDRRGPATRTAAAVP